MRNLGVLYADGSGVAENLQKSMEYYLKVADNEDASAICLLGWNYELGRGVTKGYSKAEEWYLKGVKAGGKVSCNYLAGSYSLDDNLQPQKALENYEKAAEEAYTVGILEAENLYYSGKNRITKDYAKAVKYYESYYEYKNKYEA